MKINIWALVFRAGRLTFAGSIFVALLGLGAVALAILYLPSPTLKIVGIAVGLAIAFVGGFSCRASALDLPPPFTHDPLGWRAVKRSYDENSNPSTPDDH